MYGRAGRVWRSAGHEDASRHHFVGQRHKSEPGRDSHPGPWLGCSGGGLCDDCGRVDRGQQLFVLFVEQEGLARRSGGARGHEAHDGRRVGGLIYAVFQRWWGGAHADRPAARHQNHGLGDGRPAGLDVHRLAPGGDAALAVDEHARRLVGRIRSEHGGRRVWQGQVELSEKYDGGSCGGRSNQNGAPGRREHGLVRCPSRGQQTVAAGRRLRLRAGRHLHGLVPNPSQAIYGRCPGDRIDQVDPPHRPGHAAGQRCRLRPGWHPRRISRLQVDGNGHVAGRRMRGRISCGSRATRPGPAGRVVRAGGIDAVAHDDAGLAFREQ
mmetsp:Transcript_7171/g.19625  ORF Transcript_7171/g.19625 Transcript_7171/m.19625 type:complete len:324 (-) Transcript_7171:247-1218(-)